jgi:hypothetical protein
MAEKYDELLRLANLLSPHRLSLILTGLQPGVAHLKSLETV